MLDREDGSMRVPGEWFLFINGWMDFLSLLWAAVLGRRRFRPGRTLLAAAAGTAYAYFAWTQDSWARGIPALGCVALIMGLIAFGRQGGSVTPLIFLGGWLLVGAAEWLMEKGASAALVLSLCGALTGMGCLLCRRGPRAGIGGWTLLLTLNGRSLRLPALRDSGNLLSAGASGLPVIAVPASSVQGALPPGVDPMDLSTLPRGGRLMGVRTAAGRKTVMCLFPEEVRLCRGNRQWRAEAAVALVPMPGNCALIPDSLFQHSGEGYHAAV